MDCYNIPTENHPVTIKAGITISLPEDIVIKGYDPDHDNSVYFERDIEFFKGGKEFSIPMPITPKMLMFCAFEKKSIINDRVKINYIKIEPLVVKPIEFNTESDKEFYNFIFWFASECGYLSPGDYKSPSGRFKIRLGWHIYNDDGSVSSTPARTYRDNGEIEISKEKFNPMTVYMRMMILLHERFHIRVDTRDEKVADRYAVSTYCNMGFPKSEALNAFIKVFKPINDDHAKRLIERTELLNNFLKYY